STLDHGRQPDRLGRNVRLFEPELAFGEWLCRDIPAVEVEQVEYQVHDRNLPAQLLDPRLVPHVHPLLETLERRLTVVEGDDLPVEDGIERDEAIVDPAQFGIRRRDVLSVS